MDAKEKEVITDVYERLDSLPTGIHINRDETLLQSYTRAISLIEEYRLTLKDVVDVLYKFQ
jgi:hypothetical protein